MFLALWRRSSSLGLRNVLKQRTKIFFVIHFICISCKDVVGHLHLACSQDEAIDQDDIFASLVLFTTFCKDCTDLVLVVFVA